MRRTKAAKVLVQRAEQQARALATTLGDLINVNAGADAKTETALVAMLDAAVGMVTVFERARKTR